MAIRKVKSGTEYRKEFLFFDIRLVTQHYEKYNKTIKIRSRTVFQTKVADGKIIRYFAGIKINSFDEKKIVKCFLSEIPGEIILWFDHALGGGADYFFKSQLTSCKEGTVVRIQYLYSSKKYKRLRPIKVTIFSPEERVLYLADLACFLRSLEKDRISRIVVNNLVGYDNPLCVLSDIARLKTDHTAVQVMVHDYFLICPNFFLMNTDGAFCCLPSRESCESCFQALVLSDKEFRQEYSSAGGGVVDAWRKEWGSFLSNTATEVRVFSRSSYDIVTKVYPKINPVLVPHTVQPLRKPYVPEDHSTIYIGVLGHVSGPAKGGDIVRTMSRILEGNDRVKLIVIGSCSDCSAGTKVLGRYERDKLPYIIEQNTIDIIFIPSVVSETFSYTTAEAIEMGIPIACFDIGAQSERARRYAKGLVISTIDSHVALKEMIEFVERIAVTKVAKQDAL